jgi:hypothetical protein
MKMTWTEPMTIDSATCLEPCATEMRPGPTLSIGQSKTMSNKHPVVLIPDPNCKDDLVEIDADIAPLISAMWARGWTTFNSCQENLGLVWIEMFCLDAQDFLTIVAQSARREIAWGAKYAHSHLRGVENSRDPDDWDLAGGAWNLSLVLDEEAGEFVEVGPPEILLTVGIRFPRTHLSEVTMLVARSDDRNEIVH